jgi:hypothetical protein
MYSSADIIFPPARLNMARSQSPLLRRLLVMLRSSVDPVMVVLAVVVFFFLESWRVAHEGECKQTSGR